jgi:hypothetical protein
MSTWLRSIVRGVGFSLLGFRERLKNFRQAEVKGEENLLRFARGFIDEVK